MSSAINRLQAELETSIDLELPPRFGYQLRRNLRARKLFERLSLEQNAPANSDRFNRTLTDEPVEKPNADAEIVGGLFFAR